MIAETVKLEDYRPPDFLVDDVELSFDLDAAGPSCATA